MMGEGVAVALSGAPKAESELLVRGSAESAQQHCSAESVLPLAYPLHHLRVTQQVLQVADDPADEH